MFWPSPEILKDLIVSEKTEGTSIFIEFSAPEGTECAEWLASYSETEELQQQFKHHMLTAIFKELKARERE